VSEDKHEVKREVSASFDGGDTGCGELLLDLLLFMRQQPADAVVEVRALDPGAPLEIPAWCRLTKHILLSSEHPFYNIQKPPNN
jgi:tRNA 2-thiouridine synthesizing protein A